MSSYIAQRKKQNYPCVKRISESPTYALSTGPKLKKCSRTQAMESITRSQKFRSISQKPLPPLPSCSQFRMPAAQTEPSSCLIQSYADALNEKAITIAAQSVMLRQQEQEIQALRGHVMQQHLLIETLQEDSEDLLQEASVLRQERDILRTDNTELRKTVEDFGEAIKEMNQDLDTAYGLEKEDIAFSDDASAVVVGLNTVRKRLHTM